MQETASSSRATPRPARARRLQRACKWAHASRGPRNRSPAPTWRAPYPERLASPPPRCTTLPPGSMAPRRNPPAASCGRPASARPPQSGCAWRSGPPPATARATPAPTATQRLPASCSWHQRCPRE
eukprot:14708701-Alexandrium_andersonii.AAC.1